MELPTDVVICSFRLGGTDGVAIEAEKWRSAFTTLGCAVRTVAGAGEADVIVPGLAASADRPPDPSEVAAAFAGAQLVVVENLCSLPLNPGATHVVSGALRGRPAILHHHDLASQRPHLAHFGPPPDDPAWLHICINRRSTTELRAHGYRARTLYNCFDPHPPTGHRTATRQRIGLGDRDTLVLQPTRAIARKNIPAALALAERLGATYWLLGPPEDGYDETLARVLAHASVPVVRGIWPCRREHVIDDAYAACDVVTLPSSWEGFGNPALESATRRRPLAIGPYPVGRELRRFGFQWFDALDPGVPPRNIIAPDPALLEKNYDLATRHFSTHDLASRLRALVTLVPPANRSRSPLAGTMKALKGSADTA